MSALFFKSWKSTGSIRSIHLPSRCVPQCRPYFLSRLVHTPNKSYSNTAGEKLDRATLHKFKRIVALRRQFASDGFFNILCDRTQCFIKMDREGVSFKNSLINTWKGLQLDMEHSDILSEMCEVEHRKKMKRMEADTLPELKRVSQELPMLYHDLVQVVSRFEALLEADAAQQRPLLNSQERGAIKDALKEYLGSQRWSARIRLAWALAICSLMVWGSHWYTKWVWTLRKRSVSGREGDSSELHIWDDDVE